MTTSANDRGDIKARESTAIAKTPTGIRGVEEVLFGGFPEGRTTLISGGPGSGKTLFGLEFLYRAAQAGETGVFVTFEERADTVRQNARAMGWDFAALEEDDKLAIIQADVSPDMVLSGEFTIDGLLAILTGQTRALGARRIVIDAVDVLMRIFDDPMRQQNQLQILYTWLHDQQLTAVLTAKAVEDQPNQHPFLDFMADCVIRLDQRVQGQVTTRRLRVLKYRGSGFLSNEYPYVIESGGLVLMPITSAELAHQPLGPRISGGSEALDGILGGGLRQASSVLVAGATGTGKTIFAASFVLAACHRGERALYISMEESNEALASALRSAGLDFAPAVDSGHLSVITAMPESMGVENHLLRIFQTIERFEPDHVVLDAISACSRMGSEQAAFEFLVRLVTWCKRRGVTVLCTNQIRMAHGADQISGFGISSLVDTLILLEQIHDPDYQRRMLVIKSRGSRHSHARHSFAITDEGVNFDTSQRLPGHAPADAAPRRQTGGAP